MENKKLYHDKHQAIAIGATFYIHTKQVPAYTPLAKINREENYSSLTNQNVEGINITGK